MAKLYFVIAVLFQSVVAKGAEDVCSHDGSDCRNSRALLQVASSIVHKRDATSQQEQVGLLAREQRLSAIQQGKGIGKDAVLNQAGYQSVVDQCCALEMIEFIRRVIAKEKLGYVCGEGAIAGMALWFDCKDDGKNYVQLVEALKAATTGTCAWIGAQPDCPKPPLSCGSFPDASLPPCPPPCSQTGFFEFENFGTVEGELVGPSPNQELRFKNVGKFNAMDVDLLVVNESPLPDDDTTKVEGTSKTGTITVKGGASVTLKFSLVQSSTSTALNPPPAEIHFTFLDIDHSLEGKMKEIYYFDENTGVKVEDGAEFLLSETQDGRHRIESNQPGPGCNNPRDPMVLETANVCTVDSSGQTFTTNQRKRAAMVIIKQSASFVVTLETTCERGTCNKGRKYLFAGNSALNDLCSPA